MKDFGFQISDFRLSAAECGSASLRSQFLTAYVKQSLGEWRKRVIPKGGDAEGSHKHSHCQQDIFSPAQISMRDPSLSSQLGMTEEMNSE